MIIFIFIVLSTISVKSTNSTEIIQSSSQEVEFFILTLENTTYYSDYLLLNTSSFEPVKKWEYSLNDQPRIEFTNDGVFINARNGSNKLQVFATHSTTSEVVNKTIYFTVVLNDYWTPEIPVYDIFFNRYAQTIDYEGNNWLIWEDWNSSSYERYFSFAKLSRNGSLIFVKIKLLYLGIQVYADATNNIVADESNNIHIYWDQYNYTGFTGIKNTGIKYAKISSNGEILIEPQILIEGNYEYTTLQYFNKTIYLATNNATLLILDTMGNIIKNQTDLKVHTQNPPNLVLGSSHIYVVYPSSNMKIISFTLGGDLISEWVVNFEDCNYEFHPKLFLDNKENLILVWLEDHRESNLANSPKWVEMKLQKFNYKGENLTDTIEVGKFEGTNFRNSATTDFNNNIWLVFDTTVSVTEYSDVTNFHLIIINSSDGTPIITDIKLNPFNYDPLITYNPLTKSLQLIWNNNYLFHTILNIFTLDSLNIEEGHIIKLKTYFKDTNGLSTLPVTSETNILDPTSSSSSSQISGLTSEITESINVLNSNSNIVASTNGLEFFVLLFSFGLLTITRNRKR